MDSRERAVEHMQLAAAMLPVHGNWKDYFGAIRHNYGLYSDAVRSGLVTWTYPCDPYLIADWVRIMTPIESAMWHEIRSEGLPFWPQFPVGKYMVDFADPIRKIAIECDGAAYHDSSKDGLRDKALEQMGWTTYRIPGRDCFADELVLLDRFGFTFKLESLRA